MPGEVTEDRVKVLIDENEKEFGKIIVFRSSCKIWHENIEKERQNMKTEIGKLEQALIDTNKCFRGKFNGLQKWAISILTILIVNLGVMGINLLIKLNEK